MLMDFTKAYGCTVLLTPVLQQLIEVRLCTLLVTARVCQLFKLTSIIWRHLFVKRAG